MFYGKKYFVFNIRCTMQRFIFDEKISVNNDGNCDEKRNSKKKRNYVSFDILKIQRFGRKLK